MLGVRSYALRNRQRGAKRQISSTSLDGRHQPHRIAGSVGSGDLSTWRLAKLPLPSPRAELPYVIEYRLAGGAELFRLLPPALRRSKDATIRLEFPMRSCE